jgi:hypothetical protein
MAELKEIQNRQQSHLKPGYHKIFIDRVWERMHSSFVDEETPQVTAVPNPRTPNPSC